MKKKFLLLSLFFIFFVIIFFDLYKIFGGGEKFCIDQECDYLKNKFNVYYNIELGKGPDSGGLKKKYKIPGANPDTFEILEGYYSKDNKNIFSCYFLIPDIFRAIGKCKKLEEADYKSFEVLEDDTFAKDKNNVYCNGNVTKFDPESFEELSQNYFKSKDEIYYSLNTYYCENDGLFKKIDNVDSETFEIMSFFDDENNYKTLCSESAKDKNNFYYYGKKVDNVDTEKLITLNSSCFYFKDKNNVFYGDKIINDVDVETFKTVGFDHNNHDYFFIDKNNCYKANHGDLEKVEMNRCEAKNFIE